MFPTADLVGPLAEAMLPLPEDSRFRCDLKMLASTGADGKYDSEQLSAFAGIAAKWLEANGPAFSAMSVTARIHCLQRRVGKLNRPNPESLVRELVARGLVKVGDCSLGYDE